MQRRFLLGLAGFGLLTAVPALAHHSFAAEYDSNTMITLTGVITKVEWTNPHMYIHMDVKGADGKVVNWSLEGYPPNTLKRTGYVGVAKIAMHQREHIVIFRPGASGLMMHTMYFAHEVRKVEEFRTDTSLVKDQEVKLAEMLVESLAAEFQPEKYHDSYRDNLQKLIDAKIKGQEVVTPPSVEPAKVIDIMEALKKSLAVAKKPVASEAEAPKQKAEGKKQKAAR